MQTTNIDTVVRDFLRDVTESYAQRSPGRSLSPGTGHWNNRATPSAPNRHVGHIGATAADSPRVDFVVERTPPNMDRFDVIVYLRDGNDPEQEVAATGPLEYLNGRMVRKDREVDYQRAVRKLVDALLAE